ncbi:hypothetical protein B0F90DRAFT_1749913 [Multifurca ochricompacta]|uniref:Uncharacterized protein n=1 Tax=Multifurca ochricompacta TaxID=376703 RepID=A0AAD4LYZ3_9AGAM|nr:hypothetical protein B0F90DRAFT_1749913 [Multifurca ochricompacta]
MNPPNSNFSLWRAPPTLFTFVITLMILLKLGGTLYLHHILHPLPDPPSPFTFVGSDYPRLWPIAESQQKVLMSSEESTHYQLDTHQADMEWRELIPENGTIYLGTAEQRPFSISMFHQLRCLDLIRTELLSAHKTQPPSSPSELNRHCFNYLRQMSLCRADTTLIQVLNPDNPHPFANIAVCNDWEHVYEQVLLNQQSYREKVCV